MLGIASGCLVGVLLTWVLVGAVPTHSDSGRAGGGSSSRRDPAVDWCDLDVVYAVGYVKLVITLIKYTPQVAANWRNKSTRGWSIWQILLDLAGGVLSIAQLGIDSYLQGDWSGVTGNPVKFALGNVSILYDTVFMVQHYVLYRHAGRDGKRGILPGGQEDQDQDPERDRLISDERRMD
jgi:cystinosin